MAPAREAARLTGEVGMTLKLVLCAITFCSVSQPWAADAQGEALRLTEPNERELCPNPLLAPRARAWPRIPAPSIS
jgi:hypothetical protein